ncbi:hypothetical protein IKE_03406 [Bacillus cereus VD196]|uniref:Uncharacterized protein n=1 Tax=Bacillus cereus VD196 TaxID=1053243 RepID=A0A9W5V8A6_BACCE|nr:hypothetical protein [Bacillus cereus]EOO65821.1 hypothetical protein IKE_03406 [Bacillus cereus VD196]
MPIVKPFITGRRFVSTAATETVAGADLTFANTDFTNDTGAVTTFPATIVEAAILDGATPIAIEFTIT